ncbi:uncharacterized protein LOC141613566 [Silene latifolia]|uniref:uncharacterized protein LOC141613566 n=1 Tax=Silene latifolia TaxID=37657 RepID=UPI003D7726FA
MDFESFLLKLCELFVLDDNDVDDDALIQWIMNMGEPSLYSIQMMKDRENSLFKDDNLSLAASLYKQAFNCLCFLGLPSAHSHSTSSSLAISLVLNLEAYFEPSNVKALYRRGVALQKLNFFVEALDDFEHALKLEPNNKDVSRELYSVVHCLALKTNGKRVAYHFDPLGTDRKGKKHLLNVDADTN